jgi:ribosome-interacting GTPase 1
MPANLPPDYFEEEKKLRRRKGKYDGMMVSRDFVLEDKDVIELHI